MAPVLSWASTAALLVQSALAVNHIFEKVSTVPQGWSFAEQAKGHELLKLRVAVKQQNVELFERKLMEMSDPDHSDYGNHMSMDDIQSLLRPSQAASSTVVSWLQDSNITVIADDGDYVSFMTNVETANKMLDTKFDWYRSELSPYMRLRTLSYSVPDEVASHIDFVQPTIRFGNLRKHGSYAEVVPEVPNRKLAVQAPAAGLPGGCDNYTITPQCLLNLYNVHYGAHDKTNKIGYASYLEEYARYKDLTLFSANVAPYTIGKNFSVVQFNGGLNDQNSANDSGEANLDNQYQIGVGYPIPVTEFSTGGRGPLVPDLDEPSLDDNQNEPYLDYIEALSKLPDSKIPQAISHSYGEDEQSVPASYALRICRDFAKIGARGVSIIFSSGDSGVGSACQSNDGKNTTEFQPQYPATCPYVTSVGSTQYIGPEQAANFSSGGFSRLWSRPSYQDRAVKDYLKILGNKFSKYYNRNGRAFPDVATQGFRFSVYDNGTLKHYRGTSCSAPTFAAIVGLLNDARLCSGKKSLGFLNPWLYKHADAFNDITVGGSYGCDGNGRFNGPPNGSPVIPYASFNATRGWDPVTGLGTPKFEKLLQYAAPGTKNSGGPV